MIAIHFFISFETIISFVARILCSKCLVSTEFFFIFYNERSFGNSLSLSQYSTSRSRFLRRKHLVNIIQSYWKLVFMSSFLRFFSRFLSLISRDEIFYFQHFPKHCKHDGSENSLLDKNYHPNESIIKVITITVADDNFSKIADTFFACWMVIQKCD